MIPNRKYKGFTKNGKNTNYKIIHNQKKVLENCSVI